MACYCILPEYCVRGCTWKCDTVSVGEYRFVALPASYSTVREGLNLPVWSWRDCGMLCFLPEHCARGGIRRVCPCERGIVHVCSVTRFPQHCACGIEPASVELAGLRHATLSCPSNARGVAQVDCGPLRVGEYGFVALPASYSARN